MFEEQGPEATDPALTFEVFVQRLRHYNGEIKGILSQENCADPSAFERAQYVRGLSSYTSLFPIRR